MLLCTTDKQTQIPSQCRNALFPGPKHANTKYLSATWLTFSLLWAYSPMVQCSPVQPWWQSHLPSRQTPWSMQRGWQSLCSHSGPVQPSSHWHTPPMQDPWGPQSTTHTSVVREKPGRRVTSVKSSFIFSTLQSLCTVVMCLHLLCWSQMHVINLTGMTFLKSYLT